MKVALVLTASTGGIGRHVASVAVRMRERGHQVRVFCPESTARAQGFAALGLEVHRLRDLRQTAGADVVHAHGYKAGGLAWPFARAHRTPLVVTWHNALLGHGTADAAARLLQARLARSADLTLGASSDLVAQARVLGARRAQLSPVAAPALPAPSADRAELRSALGLAPEDVVVLTVGRLAPQKNLRMVADVAAALRDRPDLVFLVAGDGPLRTELTGQVAAQRSRVRLLGARTDVADLLEAADLVLLSSTWEARALVAQEALLAGRPLVSTRVGGIAELVGGAALLVELDDVPAAAAAVTRLADDPGLRGDLAA
ncbi:MAG: glycosyl transferase group 1, partial [Friedmanniella sp.]|nr:glycosyl transferase group 1 [Friedmanniella sp.]